VAIKDENGILTKWISTATEIQSQKEQQEELEETVLKRTYELQQLNGILQRQNAELQKMNKELESFAYISSHDLQEPLRKIQTFTSWVLEREYASLSDKGKDYFDRIKSAALRMQTLIHDLLSYSHTANMEKKFLRKDLSKAVEQVKADLHELFDQRAATLEARDLGETRIIPFQFHQMIYNLIANSFKFSLPGKPLHIIIKSKIARGTELQESNPRLETGRLSPEENYCHISVSDNGIGFKQEYGERIFELFQRLYSNEEYQGTGIGLAIVKRIVENHSGTITATGELNRGATFDIYIPDF
jgi:light-regulated signal transduction histidine kinase (bacteriophytochrome)